MFKLGDKVIAYGVTGKVVAVVDEPLYPFPIVVRFDVASRPYDNPTLSYTADGREFEWAKTATLTLVNDGDK